MSIPAILRVMSSFRPGSGRTRDSSNTHRYALIPSLFGRETSQRLVHHTRPGSNSVAASTSPERLRPLPSPAMTIVLHSHPFSSPLVAAGPWALRHRRGSEILILSRDGGGAVVNCYAGHDTSVRLCGPPFARRA